MMTTKNTGIEADIANPKPVRQFNWCGQPMKDGDSYWGDSDPSRQAVVPQAAPEQSVTQPRQRKVKRNLAWTPERRAEYGAKMKAWWQAKRSSSAEAEAKDSQST